MRRLAALLLPAIIAVLAVPAAAHADTGTDFSITNMGGTTYVAPGVAGANDASVDIENGGSAEAGVLTLTFPAGLSLGPDGLRRSDGLNVTCQRSGQTATCRIAASLTGGFDVSIAAASGSRPGPTPGVRAEVEPKQSTDPDPDNNVVTLPVSVKPTARLSFDLDAPSVHYHTTTTGTVAFPVGVQTKLTCTVASHGPDTVTDLQLRFSTFSQSPAEWEFRLQPGGPTFHGAALVPIGDLAPGQSHTTSFYVTAKVKGAQDFVNCNVDQSDTQVLIEPSVDRAGNVGVVSTLTAGATPTPTPTPSPSSSSSGGLANTGVDSTGLGGLAALLLVTGAGALYLGRRRPARRHG